MERDRLKRLYHLHSVVGIVLGWLLFVVCFSGSPAMFYDEISSWEDSARHAPDASALAPINPVIEAFQAEYDGGVENLFLFLPHGDMPYYALSGSVDTETGHERVQHRWTGDQGERAADKSDGPALWLLRFHQNLMIERQIGRTLVGIAGIFMLLSIITGIVIHRKILKDLYKVRWDRSIHLKWKDLHNALGVWTLPFGITISFSGAILGIIVLLLPVLAFTAFKGDQEAALEAVLGEPPAAAGVAAQMAPLDEVITTIRETLPYDPQRVSIEHWGDANARYRVFATTDRHLVRFVEVPVNAVTGEVEEAQLISGAIPEGAAGRIMAALTPLHYGTYGGMTLKIVYYVLGILLALTVVTGTLIWLERRLNGPIGEKSEAFYRRIARLNSGVVAGLVLASVLILYSDRLIPAGGHDRLTNTGTVFMGSWLLAIAYAAMIRQARTSARHLMSLIALLSLGLPALDAVTSGGMNHTVSAWTINLVVFASGLALSIYLYVSKQPAAKTVKLGSAVNQAG